eukprot:5300241-Prymnesium_polylepis.1
MLKYEGLRARRAQAEKGRSEMENREKLGMKNQQPFQAIEGLQDAAGRMADRTRWAAGSAGRRGGTR